LYAILPKDHQGFFSSAKSPRSLLAHPRRRSNRSHRQSAQASRLAAQVSLVEPFDRWLVLAILVPAIVYYEICPVLSLDHGLKRGGIQGIDPRTAGD
jgi:hypothetical protein